MHVFNSRADFDAQMKSVKKWMRTGQALDGVADLQHDVAYSIGDSLVYWWVYAREAATADLVGHRRYHAVLAPLDGDLTVEVAPKAGLTCTRAYSDIDDRERFEGALRPPAALPSSKLTRPTVSWPMPRIPASWYCT